MTARSVEVESQSVLLGREIRAWLVRRDLKQSDIADVLGIVQSGVSHRLRGRTPFTFDQLILIAGLLDVSLAELLPAEVLHAKGPRPAVQDEDLREPIAALTTEASKTSKLPRLDSNQQPFD
ncbi:helix-turn-helix domain-containing protein [Citricoccus nitrophenolicus]|uniref:helix-turn-helix domain-containing protein n=1 Tax=Citricoccus nitrophenolicus TaxID=863575 RepID=UPI0039B5A3F1